MHTPSTSHEGLRAGSLSLFESSIMALAGSAPAYSIAASIPLLIGTVGLGAPAALLYCGVAMFGIVFAFNFLGRTEANAGASYSWVRRALHPALGFLSGWAMLVSTMIFVVFATFPAGQVTLGLFNQSWSNNVTAVTIVGSLFFLTIVGVLIAGVTITATVQVVMSGIETVLLILFAVLAIVHGHHVRSFSWSWFSPHVFHGTTGFFAGALVAAFFYWGWDVTANLNEETKGARRTPGIGGILGVIVVFLLFEVFTIATNLVFTSGQVSANSSNILQALGQAVWPGNGGKLILVAVVLSTVATVETSLIQLTRTLFSMGRDGTLPRKLGVLHPVRKTPVVASLTVAALGLLLFVAGNYVSSVGAIFTDAINALGLQICIYYGLAGLSVVVLYRKHLFGSVANFLLMGLWPGLGAVFMGVMFFKTIPTLNHTTLIVGLGSVALGVFPMVYYWIKGRPYYQMPSKLERDVRLDDLEEIDHLL